MYKLIFPLLALASVAPVAQAAGFWTIQGAEYRVDTLEHYKAGPGTTITVIDAVGPVKQRVWVCETNLTADNVDIKTYNPSLIRSTNTNISTMVANRKGDGNVYCVGVNADLFSSNGPIGTTVMGGEIIKTAKESTAWKATGFEQGKALYFGSADIKFNAKLNGKMEYAPSLVNVPRAQNETIIYTRRWGSTTGTTEGENGLELVLRPAGGALRADGPTECTVVGSPVVNGGNMAIPEGCFVLSTTVPSHIRDLGKMNDGDKYTINVGSISVKSTGFGSHLFSSVKEFIGGDPILMVDGKTLEAKHYASMPNYNSRRPRTAIGTDETHSIMKLLVVDGDSYNKGISAGATAVELADMMLAIGCYDALNFDGGGSSEMWNNKFGTLNSPSDGAPRKVRNGWFVTTPDTGDNTMSAIEFACGPQSLEIGDIFHPKFYGYTKTGVLVATEVKGVRLSVPEGLGVVNGDASYCTITGNGTYVVTAELNGMRCKLAVRAGDYDANQSGVDDVVAADRDAPVEYFTLQGIPVINPQNGAFIRRQGMKVTKVVL